MSAPRPAYPPQLQAFLPPQRLMLAGLLALVCCLYSLLARDTYGADFRAYYVAASASHAGLDPYLNQVNVDEAYADRDWLQVNSRFIYPPSSLLLFSPFAHLSYRVAKVAFGTAMAITLACSLWFLGGRFPRAGWMALALFLSLPVASNVDNGQVDGLILALMLVAFYARRPWAGGMALGVAIAIKLSPALLLLWLFTHRRWRTALWAIGSSALLSAAALVFWGRTLYREFFDHLRHHLALNPPMLEHVFHTFTVLFGRFVVMGTNTYSLHYFYGVRQNPLFALGSLAGAAGLACVLASLVWIRASRTGRSFGDDLSFCGFLVVALLANPLLWPAGLVACFPLMMLLAGRAPNGTAWGFALLVPLFAPVQIVADHRFLFWLLILAAHFWREGLRTEPAPQSQSLEATG